MQQQQTTKKNHSKHTCMWALQLPDATKSELTVIRLNI